MTAEPRTAPTIPAPRASLPRRVWAELVRRVRAPLWRSRLAAFGDRSLLESPAWIYGGKSIAVGARVRIWRGARLETFRPVAGEVRLRIGDGTVIQPGVHIGAAESVTIGCNVLFASGVYVTDHDHDVSDPFENVIHNRRLVTAPVVIGDHAWLGERVIVLKGVTIGERSIVGAGSVVTRDVPPLSIAAGVPARVLRRFDRERGAWVAAEPR